MSKSEFSALVGTLVETLFEIMIIFYDPKTKYSKCSKLLQITKFSHIFTKGLTSFISEIFINFQNFRVSYRTLNVFNLPFFAVIVS